MFVMHSKRDNTEIMVNDKADEVIKVFKSLLSRYEIWLETSMRGNDFIFGCIDSLNYKFRRMNLKRGGSYIDFPIWIKTKKTNNKSF